MINICRYKLLSQTSYGLWLISLNTGVYLRGDTDRVDRAGPRKVIYLDTDFSSNLGNNSYKTAVNLHWLGSGITPSVEVVQHLELPICRRVNRAINYDRK